MTYDEMMQQLANAKPASFDTPAPITKALPSSAALSTRDKALISGLAPAIHEYVQTEIAKAVAPLKAEIAQLRTLTDFLLRPPESAERRGHSDAGGPHPNNYCRQ
jgi:hypothetical protein